MSTVRALYACDASESSDELSFQKGDIIENAVESQEPGWYFGVLQKSGESGLFPFNYVEIVPAILAPSKPRKNLVDTGSKPTLGNSRKENTSEPTVTAVSAGDNRFRASQQESSVEGRKTLTESNETANGESDSKSEVEGSLSVKALRARLENTKTAPQIAKHPVPTPAIKPSKLQSVKSQVSPPAPAPAKVGQDEEDVAFMKPSELRKKWAAVDAASKQNLPPPVPSIVKRQSIATAGGSRNSHNHVVTNDIKKVDSENTPVVRSTSSPMPPRPTPSSIGPTHEPANPAAHHRSPAPAIHQVVDGQGSMTPEELTAYLHDQSVPFSERRDGIQDLPDVRDAVATALQSAVTHANWETFELLLMVAAAQPDPAYVSPIAEALATQGREVPNQDALEVLAAIGSPGPLALLKRIALTAYDWDEFSQISIKAVWAINAIDTPQAHQALAEIARDGNEYVRHWAQSDPPEPLQTLPTTQRPTDRLTNLTVSPSPPIRSNTSSNRSSAVSDIEKRTIPIPSRPISGQYETPAVPKRVLPPLPSHPTPPMRPNASSNRNSVTSNTAKPPRAIPNRPNSTVNERQVPPPPRVSPRPRHVQSQVYPDNQLNAPPLPTRPRSSAETLTKSTGPAPPPRPAPGRRQSQAMGSGTPPRPTSHLPPPPTAAVQKSIPISDRIKYDAIFNENNEQGYIHQETALEIWRASRIGEQNLSDIAVLIDIRGDGWLDQKQFAAGTFLIDDRLRGFCIPKTLPDSIM
jgi:hypothetical protein